MGSFDRFIELISHGNYDEVIELIDNDPNPTERLLLFKSEALIYNGSFDIAYQLVKPFTQSEDLLIKVDAIRQKSLIHWSLGEFNQAIELIERAYDLLANLDETKLDDLSIKAHVLHMYGTICQSTGQLDQSLSFLKQSLSISEDLGNQHRIAATLANLAIVHSYMGDQEKTLENYNSALIILKDLGKSGDEALVLGLLGETYWELGKKAEAIKYKIKSLDILREFKNYYRIADSLYVLINFLLLFNRNELANSYYNELVKVNKSSDAYNIDIMTRFAEGLILKFSPRVKQKIIAQGIFEDLLEEELDFEIRSEILLHLSDLLIDELRTYSEPEVLVELNSLYNQIYQMASNQNNRYLSTEALILKAKMEIINTNFTEADRIFEEASLLAEKHAFDFLKDKAELERKLLQEDLVLWQTLLSKGASIKERIDQSKIRDYL
ncbi:MAG: tetratricopeptide repeat protein, partial [Candidatus Heimdallarchaeota archaeon]